jgi:hypothetical protein
MKHYIIHANQEVVVSSPQKYWPTETLRSKPTFAIDAVDLNSALKHAEDSVRHRYETKSQHVESVFISAQLVRQIEIS